MIRVRTIAAWQEDAMAIARTIAWQYHEQHDNGNGTNSSMATARTTDIMATARTIAMATV